MFDVPSRYRMLFGGNGDSARRMPP